MARRVLDRVGAYLEGRRSGRLVGDGRTTCSPPATAPPPPPAGCQHISPPPTPTQKLNLVRPLQINLHIRHKLVLCGFRKGEGALHTGIFLKMLTRHYNIT